MSDNKDSVAGKGRRRPKKGRLTDSSSSTASRKAAKVAPVVRRQALLVLGMHRSGTSMCSGLLSKLGAASPKTLMKANERNPKGYYESSAFMAFHDKILASAGSDWADWTRFNPDWFETSSA